MLLAFIAASIVLVLLLYYRNKENNELEPWQVRVLGMLRFLSIFTVSFLLLAPFIKNLKKISQKPIVIFALDNSTSMVNNADSVEIRNEIDALKSDFTNNLGTEYQIINYTFGSEVIQQNNDLVFDQKESDYGNLLQTINQNHFNENVGAVVLLGDGIYNKGKNPVNLANVNDFPVYTIALGDTNVVLDAGIEEILANRTAFSGNKFKVEIACRFSKLKNTALKISILHEGEEISARIITPPSNDYFSTQEFTLDAKGKGLQQFIVQVQTVEGERNRHNNRSQFVINVLENKQKILIISDGNHPDIGVIKNTLEQQITYEVSVFTQAPYPSNLKDFNLVILNQVPTVSNSMSEVFDKLEQQKIPSLILTGSNTFIPQFNSIVKYAEIKPLAGNTFDEAQAIYNPGFGSFTYSENVRESLDQFPPLQVPFANFETDAGFTTLLSQKIKNIETVKPLMTSGKFAGVKRGIIFGEGIWRWRLFDYQSGNNHSRFNEIINQFIQYLALRENEDNFMINYQPVYTELEHLKFTAELYNDVFEAITTEEIALVISNDKGEEYDYIFDKGSNGYRLDAGNFAVGNYSFNAEVTLGEETFTESGEFSVLPVNIEQINSRANHQLLYLISEISGGKFYNFNQSTELIKQLKNNPLKTTHYFQEMISELLNLKALFFVLLILLSVEWFLRKYWGVY